MQIVIDIPEKVYKLYEFFKNEGVDWLGAEHILSAMTNGTPLPKGHGRLVDIGQCDRKLFYQQCGGADSLITVKSAFDMLMLLPPIIEAESEG